MCVIHSSYCCHTDPCIDNGHPCFNEQVSCKKITDTDYECGACPRGMRGDGLHCAPVNEVSKPLQLKPPNNTFPLGPLSVLCTASPSVVASHKNSILFTAHAQTSDYNTTIPCSVRRPALVTQVSSAQTLMRGINVESVQLVSVVMLSEATTFWRLTLLLRLVVIVCKIIVCKQLIAWIVQEWCGILFWDKIPKIHA